jgi:hypothetical protein
MDAGTAHDMIEDLMVQLAIVRSELFLLQSEFDYQTKKLDIWTHIAQTEHLSYRNRCEYNCDCLSKTYVKSLNDE